MGDPRRIRKKYETPRHPWRMDQIAEELRLIGEYGLRNKRELWKYKTMLSKIRGIARSLLGRSEEERARLQKEYVSKMSKLGLLKPDAAIDDILDLDIRSLLEKRLQTVVYRRGFSKTIHHAREMIVHGHVRVGDRVISIPGYLVTREDDPRIAVIGGADQPGAPAEAHRAGERGG
ncbi:MAG: 30S ribosomal protein S4 [Candidatus Bathyarchaeia archaeon]